MSKILTLLTENYLFSMYKYYIIDSVFIVKNRGFKELLRTRGLKFILVVIGYYIIRDSFILSFPSWQQADYSDRAPGTIIAGDIRAEVSRPQTHGGNEVC